MKPDDEPLIGAHYRAIQIRTGTGEHLPLLIDRQSGIPPTVALRFTLRERNKGGAARLLNYLRRIAELYSWYRQVKGVDLDELIFDDKLLARTDILMALEELEKTADQKQNKTPRLRNQRIAAWSNFVIFISRPELWRSGLSIPAGYRLAEESENHRNDLREALAEETEAVADGNHHDPLSVEELAAIEAVLDPSSPMNPFEEHVRLRNSSMVHVARYAAFRLGELLKMLCHSYGPQESPSDKAIRQIIGEPQIIQVVRNPDDPRDPRRYEPRVKRGGREVEIPDFVFAELLRYIRETKKKRQSPYLYLTEDFKRPLSMSRSDKIVRQLGTAASKVLAEKDPKATNTLARLHWHRFRATRAVELVPLFFKDMKWSAIDEEAFLEFFGWNDRESAKPYLKSLYRQRVREVQARRRSDLREARKSHA